MRQQHKKHVRRKPRSLIGLWLLIGVLGGVLISVALYQLFIHPSWFEATAKKESYQTSKKKSKAPRKLPVKAQTPRFEFYQLLPGMEVPIEEAPSETKVPSEAKIPNTVKIPSEAKMPIAAIAKPQPLIKPAPETHTKVAAPQYLIQTAAYRAFISAEKLKSQLISQGFSPRIQKIEAEDGIWYRVIVGPFPSETMALHQKNRLAKSHIQGILILQRR